MNFWLLKTEPSRWSWSQQLTENSTVWDGVRNALAQKHLRSMTVGDRAFFYHTGKDKHICGTVTITKEAYPDPTDETQRFSAVDVTTDQPFKNAVSLSTIKAHDSLAHLALVRLSRLSVMPIDPPSWTLICQWGGLCQ